MKRPAIKTLRYLSWLFGLLSMACAIGAPAMSIEGRCLAGAALGSLWTMTYLLIAQTDKHVEFLTEQVSKAKAAIEALTRLINFTAQDTGIEVLRDKTDNVIQIKRTDTT